jgi:5-methyltetrahydropteroyltriglutamate--homocysteine methyltransferase
LGRRVKVLKLKDVVDIPLPTTQVGMYPRPTWYHYNIRDRGWVEVCSDPAFLETYTDAVRTIILDQETAGLDILTDGCVRYDDNLADGISSWLSNNIAYMSGVKKVEGRPEGKTLMEGVLGEDNVMAADKVRGYPIGRDGWWWVIEDEPSFGKLGIWLETIKVALPYARRPLKFSAPSAAVASRLAVNKTQKSDRDIYFDLSRVQNKALHEIVNAGVKIIQVDYPFALAHWAAQFNELSKDLWKDLIDAFNEEIKGVNANIWVHFCFGAPILFGEETPPLAYHMGKVYPHIAECEADCIQS